MGCASGNDVGMFSQRRRDAGGICSGGIAIWSADGSESRPYPKSLPEVGAWVGRFLRNRRYRCRVADGSESRLYPYCPSPKNTSSRSNPVSLEHKRSVNPVNPVKVADGSESRPYPKPRSAPHLLPTPYSFSPYALPEAHPTSYLLLTPYYFLLTPSSSLPHPVFAYQALEVGAFDACLASGA